MEDSKGLQVVLRDVHIRLKNFLEHMDQLQQVNHYIQEQIVAWKMLLKRDWSEQERTVEDLRTQVSFMLMENAELALRSDHVKSSLSLLQSRCELEERVRLHLEQQVSELRRKKSDLELTNNDLEKQLHTFRQELQFMEEEQESGLHLQQQQQEEAALREDGTGMELWHFGPAHGHLSSSALSNRIRRFRSISHIGPGTDTSRTLREEHPQGFQVSRGDEVLREARAELADVRKRWHSLQVEVESLHAVERSLQSSLRHNQHQYSLQLRDLSQSVTELETELEGVREGLAVQKHHHSQLLNTKMRLEKEISTYRKLLEHEEGRFLSVDGQMRKLKPWRKVAQQNGVCNGLRKDGAQSDIAEKPVLHRQGSLVIVTEPTERPNGEISTVKTQEIVEGKVVQESAEGHGRVETEKIDQVIKQWEGSFFEGNPKLRKKSVSLRFDLHMAMADEGCAQSKQDCLPDVEVRLVMKRSRSIPTITQ